MPKQPKQARKRSGANTTAAPTQDEIALLAYELWQRRGCPVGSPEEDWNQAEIELRKRRQFASKIAAAAGLKYSAAGM